MKVWMRLGIEFDATEEEMLAIQGDSTKMMELLKTKEIEISGNSYIPETGGLYNEGEDIEDDLYEQIFKDSDFDFFDGDTFTIKA